MKVCLEWLGESPKMWRHVSVDEEVTRNGNLKARHGGKVYVYKDHRPGSPVISLDEDGKWVEVGRVDCAGRVFVGPEDALSSAEHRRSPEGAEEARKLLESLQKAREGW